MTSICPRCNNFTLYCRCVGVTTAGSTVSIPSQQPQTFTFTPQLTEEQVRKIVREELAASKREIVKDAVQELVKQIRLLSGVKMS